MTWLHRSRWPTIALVLGAGVVSAFQVGKAPMALAAVQSDLSLGLTAASWLLSAFSIIGAVAGVAVGVAVDRIGPRLMAIGALFLQGAACALGAFSERPEVLLATRAVEGLGFLALIIAAPALLVAVAREHELGRAMAAWATFMPVGMCIVMLGAPLLTMWGWRGFWIANSVLLITYAMLLTLGTHSVSLERRPRSPIARDIRDTLRARGPWVLAALFGAFSAAYFAVFGFLPLLLEERLKIGSVAASLLTAFAIAVNAGGNLAAGQLLNRGVPASRLLSIAFVVMGVSGAAVFIDAVPGAASYAFCVVLSGVSGLIPVALFAAVPRHAARPDLIGATAGLLMQGNNAGLMLGPASSGALAAAFGWPVVSALVAAVAMSAAFLTHFAKLMR